MTPDPTLASASASNPITWNRYSYVLGDPANSADPSGLCTINGVVYIDGVPPCPNDTSVTVYGGPPPPSSVFPPGGFPTFFFAVPDYTSVMATQITNGLPGVPNVSAAPCPPGEVRFSYGCDVPLDPRAQAIFAQINAMNPQGFINAYGLAVAGAVISGFAANAALYGTLAVEASNNMILLGRAADGYVTLGGVVGAGVLNIPQDVWNSLSEVEQWAVNKAFLDGAIGDNALIMFSSDPRLAAVLSGLGQEYQYLLDAGYHLATDANGGWIMVK